MRPGLYCFLSAHQTRAAWVFALLSAHQTRAAWVLPSAHLETRAAWVETEGEEERKSGRGKRIQIHVVAPSSCSEKNRTAEGCRWLGVLRGEGHSAVDRLLLSPSLLSAGSSRLAGRHAWLVVTPRWLRCRLLARHASLIVGAVVAAVLGVL